MSIVALDTNTLMMPVELDVRVFDELDRLLGAVEPVVPRAVLDELDRLAAATGPEAAAARVGRDLADRCRVVDHAAATADDAVVELAADDAVDFVATNDRPLADRVLAAGVPVIGIRGRSTLAITEP